MMRTTLLLVLSAGLASTQDAAPDTPREFGRVQWQRALEPALDAARENGKPVLLLFQEVPG